MPLDETGVADASYGPAGLVREGAEYAQRDREALRRSIRLLRAALVLLRREDRRAWEALVNPYLGDPGDPSMVDDWRRKVAELDAENAAIRAENERRRKKGRPERPERVRHVTARTQLERHDRAVRKLAGYLAGKRLNPVWPKLMSERERAAGEAANAQLYAYYQRVRVAGRTHRGAVAQTAVKFEVPEDAVERVVEFRSEVKLATCAEEGCGREVFQQNLCVRHYNREYRARKGRAG